MRSLVKNRVWRSIPGLLVVLTIVQASSVSSAPLNSDSAQRYSDAGGGDDWPGYGRTFGQQHYSPLAEIDRTNVGRLGLAWSIDLGSDNSATQPIEVAGVLYFATGLSVIHAVDAASGKDLWRYDPGVAEKAKRNLRMAWGVRGIAWSDNKIYTGTQDGRLIAIDAQSGVPVWSVKTFDSDYPAHINGAPHVFNGKVIIGYGSSTGATRGYVTTYDAETGKLLWRFYTVPGNPAHDFENDAMRMARKTWAGHWWEYGGGGDVWNSISYDNETDTVFIGTGSAYPWNRRARSADRGDNLFVASIVALNGTTGVYQWHYQVSPGDTWDHDATMDIELADLTIDGKARKVFLQAPKNGFFYVIDRVTGKLISAEPYAKVTWANRIDLTTGRPVEVAGARYPNGTTADIWPSSAGAHSWQPMAYSPKTQLAYIPVIELGNSLSDKGQSLKHWRAPTDRGVEGAVTIGDASGSGTNESSHQGGTATEPPGALVAWSPALQKAMWRVSHPTYINGGLLATGGDLVFQGTVDGTIKAYSADSGTVLWSFPAEAPLVSTPITYSVNGHQYITMLSGLGMAIASGLSEQAAEQYGVDPRSQARRVLTFALDGNTSLPRAMPPLPPPSDPSFHADQASADAGREIYDRHCVYCHGVSAVASIHAPDLRRSAIPMVPELFAGIVRDGRLVSAGMPRFEELTDPQVSTLRQFLRTQAEALRHGAN